MKILKNVSFETINTKKITAKVLVVTFLLNIIAPGLIFAVSLPDYTNNLNTANVVPVAQVDSLSLPRTLLSGDVLQVTIDTITVTQDFSWSSDETSLLFNEKLDNLVSVNSSFDNNTQKFTITASVPGTAFNIGNLTITRTPTTPDNTVLNVVAVAQVSEISIPQELFSGDTVNFWINWTLFQTAFSGTKDDSLTSLAQDITANTPVSAVYSGTTSKIVMTAKTPWIDFSMSNLIITSNGTAPVNIVANVIPVAQVEKISFPRNLYNDETISLTLSWNNLSQAFDTDYTTTINSLSTQINNLWFVNSSLSGSDLIISSAIPGQAFTTWSVNLVWATNSWVNISPNVIALAQRNDISVPRDLVDWDTINFTLWTDTLTQSFSGTSNDTILALNDQINSLSWVFVSAYNPALRTISVKSTSPWIAFANPSLYISSSFASANLTANQVAIKQASNLTFPKALVAGDTISAIVNGSPYSLTFSGTNDLTISDFASLIASSNSGILNITNTSNSISIEAVTAGTPFSLWNLNITNTLSPTVLVANVVPVKEQMQLTVNNTIVAWDNISLDVNWTLLTQAFTTDETTTLNALNTQIDWVSGIKSTLVWKVFTIEARTAGTAFTVGNITTSGSTISSNILTWAVSETKAWLSFIVNAIPTTWDFLDIWTCHVTFIAGSGTTNDCSTSNANIDTTWIVDTSTVASLIRWLSSVSDAVHGSLAISWIGSNVIVNATTTPASNWDINLAYSTWVSSVIFTPWIAPIAWVQTIDLTRDFAPGDTFTALVNGITVTQNFASSNTVSFNNLVSQINSLPNLSATWASNQITITAALNTNLTISGTNFQNTTSPLLIISNITAVAEKKIINFPSSIVASDEIQINIDGTTISSSGTTSLADLVSQITTNTQVNASLSGSLGLVLEAKNAGTSFNVNSTKITNTSTSTTTQINVVWVAQVNTLTVPFSLVSGDTLTVNINGNPVSQTFVSDEATTLAALNTKIDALAEVNSSVDTTTKIFTITSSIAGTSFTASLAWTSTVINGTNIEANVENVAQIDNLVVNREIAAWDNLSLDIAGHTLTQAFLTDKTTTLNALNTQINTLTEVSSVFDWTSTFTITSKTAGTAFTTGILTINSTYPSTSQVANVPAVAQIDTLTLSRDTILGDKLSLMIDSGSIINTSFSGTNTDTLNDFVANINASQTWAIATVLGNTITFTASVAGVPFHVNSFVLENTSLGNTTTNNVVAVAQEDEFPIPTFVVWDTLYTTINGTGIVESFNTDNATTISNLLNKINTSIPEITATYNSASGIINLRANTPGTPFTINDVSIINTTAPVLETANVPALAQVVEFTPSGAIRQEITFRTTVDWVDYDYTTSSGETISSLVSWIAALFATSTWVLATTTANTVVLTAATPGVAFTYDSKVLDIMPPIVSSSIAVNQTLRTSQTSVSNVSISEDGDIYLVLSGSTITSTWDLLDAVNSGSGFLAQKDAMANTYYNVTVPAGIVDWKYNFVAIDIYGNISQIIDGWLTVDNTPPAINITTASGQTLNTDTITIQWTTESNILVNVAGMNIFSDWAGNFSKVVTLNHNTVNNILILATDAVWNTSTTNFSVTHDDMSPNPFTLNAPAYTNSWVAQVSVHTENSLQVEAYSGVTLLATWTTDNSGNASFDLSLDINAVNNFHIVATDLAGNTSSGNVSIVQDSIAPTTILDATPSIIHAGSLTVSGNTESNATLVVTNSGFTSTGTADASGNFSIDIPLESVALAQTLNNITVISTDLAGNTYSTGLSITEDSIPNALIIGTPNNMFVQNTAFTLTWTTKPGATVDVNGTPAINTSWNFSWDITLNANLENSLLITSSDQVGNTLTGTLTVTHDSIAPNVSITTGTTPTNATLVNITWTSEANTPIVITGGSGTFSQVTDASGTFNIAVDLNAGFVNNLTVSATDLAGNIGTWTISIFQDPIINFVTLPISGVNYANTDTFAITWNTKSFANVTVTWASGTLNLVADSNWVFSGTIVLNQNTQNDILVSSTDATLTTSTWGFTIIHDNITPTISNLVYPNATNGANAIITWNADTGSILTATSGTASVNASSASGTFTINFPLVNNSTNNIVLTATDAAGNTSSGTTISILHDSIAPVVANIAVTQSLVWTNMLLNYSFDTDKITDSTIYIGTWTNVLATLVASDATLASQSHSGTISWFDSTKNYYYFITSTDVVWNTTTTTITTINAIPVVVPPVTPPVVYSGWGGGGSISRDYCPSGDYSYSYYDNSCGVKPASSTGTTSSHTSKEAVISTWTTNQNNSSNNVSQVASKAPYKKYIKYKGYFILDIKNYKDESVFRKTAFDIIRNDKISAKDKIALMNRHNSLLEAKFALDIAKNQAADLADKYIKRLIIFNAYYERVAGARK